MKLLLHIWFVLMILAGILVGCNRAPQYDSRLLAADSIIYKQYKLALKQLDSIKPEELTNSADRAYYALLLTQARYLNYFDSLSDQDINYALNYYKKHDSEHEKLSRAYLIKGGVLEDHNKPDSAMYYYKLAEDNAHENGDNFNNGYALLRMSKLYISHHAYDGRDIENMEQALAYFKLANDTTYQIVCLKELGALYRTRNADFAETRLKDGIALSKIAKDTDNLLSCYNNLAYLYFMRGQKEKDYNRKAYNELQHIKSYGLKGLRDNIYTTFACVYANVGKPDSAILLLKLSNYDEQDEFSRHSNNYLEAIGQIAKAQGDLNKYYKLSHESDSITFSSIADPLVFTIIESEVKHNEQQKYKQEKENRNKLFILALVSAALLLLALVLYRRSHRYDKLVLELKDQSDSQMQDLTGMQKSISELQINDERLKGFISSHMGMMRDIIEACYHEPNNRIAENMKRIIKFQDSNKENWVRLYDYIDLEHNNIMTRTRENYPDLNDRELLLLALTCMGYSYIQIAIIMGYSNATSVSVIKQRLVKKMKLDCSLNEYIQKFENTKN